MKTLKTAAVCAALMMTLAGASAQAFAAGTSSQALGECLYRNATPDREDGCRQEHPIDSSGQNPGGDAENEEHADDASSSFLPEGSGSGASDGSEERFH